MSVESQLIALVQDMLKDADLAEATILGRLNQGLDFVSGALWLPGNRRTYAVITDPDRNFTELPPDFMDRNDNLDACFSFAQQRNVEVFESWDRFVDYHTTLNDTGDILRVCVFEGKLWYQPRPSSSDCLTLHYHSYPRPLPTVILKVTSISDPAATGTAVLKMSSLSASAVPRPGQAITATGGGTGTIVHYDPALALLHLAGCSGTFSGTITASTGWTATIDDYCALPVYGETVTGNTSGATATVAGFDHANSLIKCRPHSGTFVTSPAETITGSSGWTATMNSLPTIANETVTGIPPQFQDGILTNYACREIVKSYTQIEIKRDFSEDFAEWFHALKQSIGPRKHRPRALFDDGDYIS